MLWQAPVIALLLLVESGHLPLAMNIYSNGRDYFRLDQCRELTAVTFLCDLRLALVFYEKNDISGSRLDT